jgi:membrane protease YdiL (CAAX protease family)
MAIRNRGSSFRRDARRLRGDYSLAPAVVGVVAQILVVASSFSVIYKGQHFLALVPFLQDSSTRDLTGLLVAIGSFTVVPVCEELLFRSLLASNPGFRRGKWGMIIVAAFFFASGHVSRNFWPTFLGAIVWALILRRTKNITISISLHATWNFLCSLPFLIGFCLPHFVGWNGLVSAPVYSAVHAVARVGGFTLFGGLIVYLSRSPNRWSRESRRHPPRKSSELRDSQLVAA